MQEQYSVYANHKKEINQFIMDNISNLSNISKGEDNNFSSLFNLFSSLKLVYYCDYDEENMQLSQISDNIFRNKSIKPQNKNKNYLIKKLKIKKNKPYSNIYISKPYLSEESNAFSITVAIKENDKVYCLNMTLSGILQRLGFLEIHPTFTNFIKYSYFIIGNVMVAFAAFAVFYSIYEFTTFIMKNTLTIDSIFKPVITLTLGLAIFDLAKTILEQEVVFKKYSSNTRNDSRILTKFSTTIIVALLIESLMVVFKMALHESANMIQAFYLIAGVSLLIVSLGAFIAVNNRVK